MKILFLDNSKIVLDTLQMLMKNITDIEEVSFYQNPYEVKELLDSGELEFDILFSEIIFKELDGLELITSINDLSKQQNKLVAIITKEYDQSRLDALKILGIKDIFIKSIYSDHLEIFLQDVITAEAGT